MTHYVDGFLLPIAPERLAEYQKMADLAGSVWKEHGALAYWECVGDDLQIADMVSFKQSAGCKENETVVLAWIVYPSREARDRINEAVMADPRLQASCNEENPPFDYKRMVCGGFKELVHHE
jgi:uncharacterized protein YbaA (DUF1428 family)